MENHHFSWVNQLKMAIFNSYVSLPEGIINWLFIRYFWITSSDVFLRPSRPSQRRGATEIGCIQRWEFFFFDFPTCRAVSMRELSNYIYRNIIIRVTILIMTIVMRIIQRSREIFPRSDYGILNPKNGQILGILGAQFSETFAKCLWS